MQKNDVNVDELIEEIDRRCYLDIQKKRVAVIERTTSLAVVDCSESSEYIFSARMIFSV